MNPKRVLIPGFSPTVNNHKDVTQNVNEENVMFSDKLNDLISKRSAGEAIDYSKLTLDEVRALMIEAAGGEDKLKTYFTRIDEQMTRVKLNDREQMRRSRYINRLQNQLDGIVEQMTPVEVELDLQDPEKAITQLQAMDARQLKKVLESYPDLGLSLELMTPDEVVNNLIVHLFTIDGDSVVVRNHDEDVAEVEVESEEIAAEAADDDFDFSEANSPVVTVAESDLDEDTEESDDDLSEDTEESDDDEGDDDEDDEEDNAELMDAFENSIISLIEAETYPEFLEAVDAISESTGFELLTPAPGAMDAIQEAMHNFLVEVGETEGGMITDGSELPIALGTAISAANFMAAQFAAEQQHSNTESFDLVNEPAVSLDVKARLVVVASMSNVRDMEEIRGQLSNIQVPEENAEFAPESLNFFYSVRGLSIQPRPTHKRYGALSSGLRNTFDALAKFNQRDLLIAGPMNTIPDTLALVSDQLSDEVVELFEEGFFGVSELPEGLTLDDFVQVETQTDLDDEGNVIITVYTALRVPMLYREDTRNNLYNALLNLSDETAVEVTLMFTGSARDLIFNRNMADGDDVFDLSAVFEPNELYSATAFTLVELNELIDEVHADETEEESDDDFDDTDEHFIDEESEEETEEDDSDEEDEDTTDFDPSVVPMDAATVMPWGEDVIAIIPVEHKSLDADDTDDADIEVE